MHVYVAIAFLMLFNGYASSLMQKTPANKDFVRKFEKPFITTQNHNSETPQNAHSYSINDINGFGHKFDGIGAVSGGGATSRLLVNYAEPYRSQILDYLFKPNFGASLQILKVEIGGDGQSTDGTEATHMRNENEENYTRGYEWWVMKEAKARNPQIKLVGLPWCWPGWIGLGTVLPYENQTLTALYIAKWVKGAKEHHGLQIDYVGIWNERPYDVQYIKTLRKILNSFGFSNVGIIAADKDFSPISEAILQDPDLAEAVEVIGAHYPGTHSSKEAQETTKVLWSSEDYSTYNDITGAGCWARLLNQNYINGNMTATIAWNLVASYYDHLAYDRCSLMTANEPWSGHYESLGPIWVTAHTTQFTNPGWHYLKTVGHLSGGGSYVALTDGQGNLTIVVETLSHDQSICIRPFLPPYTVVQQNITFVLGGKFKGAIARLNMWQSQLGAEGSENQLFINKGSIPVNKGGELSLVLPVDSLVTFSTIGSAKKGSYPVSPKSAPFPLSYSDNFGNNGFTEAFNFADQSGKFELYHNASADKGHDWTLRQVVTIKSVTLCDDPDLGISLIGDYNWANVTVSVETKLEKAKGVFVALRVDKGSCDTRISRGIFLWIMNDQSWMLTADLAQNTKLVTCAVGSACWVSETQEWNNVTLSVSDRGVVAYLNGVQILTYQISKEDRIPSNGFVAIGTANFATAQFDSFDVKPSLHF